MALHKAIEQARRQTATRANRVRQMKAELRLEEIVKVAGISDQYDRIDRAGDLNIETAFARIFQMAETKAMRDAIVDCFVAWQADEKAEEAIVHGETQGAVSLMKFDNPLFIEDQPIPFPSAGFDGDAA